jgi:hypothetical protein
MHLEEGTIHAWIDGALDAEESARVEQHVAECATCANAVAEARGLVAGASRILAALDDVPSGVLPRIGGGGALGGSSSSARRPRSLWTYLHLTPARAAAAAFLIVAAGTALVMRSASAPTSRNVVSVVSAPRARERSVPVPATPLPAATSGKVADSAALVSSNAHADAPLRGVATSRPVKAALPMAAPPAAIARNDAMEKRNLEQVQVTASANSASAAAAPAPQRIRADSTRRLLSDAQGAEGRAVAGGALRAASAMNASAAPARSPSAGYYAGCYSVAAHGDSAPPLPKLVSLDSARVDKAFADQFAPIQRFAVSALTDAGRRLIDTASWQPMRDGVRISFGRTPISLLRSGDSTLSMAGVAGRGLSMTLQRVACPR